MERILETEYMDTEEEACDYDSMDHHAVNAAFVERLHELGAHGRVLDLGTGPGQIAIAIAESADDFHVLGIDAAGTMLAIAEERKSHSPAADRIEFQQGDATKLDLPDQSFDAVVSNTVLHHIPRPVEFLQEAGRLLKPGGVLLIRDLFRPESPEAVTAIVEANGEGLSPTGLKLFRDSLHASLTQKELRAAAVEAGLEAFGITQDTDRHMSLQKK